MYKEFTENIIEHLCPECGDIHLFRERLIGNKKDGYEGTGEFECDTCETKLNLVKCDYCNHYVEEDETRLLDNKRMCSCCEDHSSEDIDVEEE